MKVYESKQTGLATGVAELISIEDVKEWAAIDTDLDDAVIASIISSAREMVESFISKDLISKNRLLFTSEMDDKVNHIVVLPYNAKDGTITVKAEGNLLVEGSDYEVVGIGGKYIKFNTLLENILVEYESQPINSASELDLANSATKVLIEQIYNNRANLEGGEDIDVFDTRIKKMLSPVRTIYL